MKGDNVDKGSLTTPGKDEQHNRKKKTRDFLVRADVVDTSRDLKITSPLPTITKHSDQPTRETGNLR